MQVDSRVTIMAKIVGVAFPIPKQFRIDSLKRVRTSLLSLLQFCKELSPE